MIASFYRSRIYLHGSHAVSHIMLYSSFNKRRRRLAKVRPVNRIRGIQGVNSGLQHQAPDVVHYSTTTKMIMTTSAMVILMMKLMMILIMIFIIYDVLR